MLKRILITAFLGGALVLTGPAQLANADGRHHRHHSHDRHDRHGHSYHKGYERGYRHGYRDGSHDDHHSSRRYSNNYYNNYYYNYYHDGSYRDGGPYCSRRCGGGLLDLNVNLDVL